MTLNPSLPPSLPPDQALFTDLPLRDTFAGVRQGTLDGTFKEVSMFVEQLASKLELGAEQRYFGHWMKSHRVTLNASRSRTAEVWRMYRSAVKESGQMLQETFPDKRFGERLQVASKIVEAAVLDKLFSELEQKNPQAEIKLQTLKDGLKKYSQW